MTKETAERVAKWNSTEDITKWSSEVAKFAAYAQPQLAETAGKACAACPFRNNASMGGCIGEDCPVSAARKAMLLTTKRMSAGVKEIFKAKCRVKSA